MCRMQNIPQYEHDRIVYSILSKVGLYEWRYKVLRQLSGGMQRRISIAMALLNSKTRLMILDEPSTGLDPQTKRVIWSVIKKTAKEERSSSYLVGTNAKSLQVRRVQEDQPGIVITSHDMNELDTLCDSI